MSDLISREALINSMDERYKKIKPFVQDNLAEGFAQMEKLIKEHQSVTDTNVGSKWIPCSERLPEKRDWYLAVFKEPDTGFIGLPYIADYLMGNHTAYTTKDGWIIKDCTDRNDCESLYHKNLECVAWMPLPEPYKADMRTSAE